MDIAGGMIKRRMGKPDLPRTLVYKVTRRCNLFCEMCYTHEGERQQELTPSEVARFFQHPGMSGLHLLRLTGGEPTLREDFPELTRACLSGGQPRFLYLTTNGSFPDRLESWLKEVAKVFFGVWTVQVSVDAADERHDQIRGKKGSLEKTKDSLSLLQQFQSTHPQLSIGVNQTISRSNLDTIGDVAEFAKQYGAQHTVILAQDEHETREKDNQDGAGFKLKTELSPAEIEVFYAALEKYSPGSLGQGGGSSLQSRLRDLTQAFVHEQEDKQLTGAPPPRQKCMSAFTYIRLAPDGEVTPCTLKNGLKMGNIRHQSFEEIWLGSAAQEARRQVSACSGCWVECDVIPSFAYQPSFYLWAAKELLLAR